MPDLIAGLATPVLTTSMTGQVTGFNAAAAALLGAPAELYTRNIQDVLPFAPGPRDAAASESQGQIVDASGRPIDLEVSRTVVGDDDEHAYAVYVVHEVSRYLEVNRQREQLLYSVAHELRNPVAVLDSALEMLQTDPALMSAHEFSRVLGVARRTSVRMRTLLDDLLSVGNIRSGHFVIVPQMTDLVALITDARDIVSADLAARGQQVELELPEDGLAVWADARYAPQVLTNLLSNASRYGPMDSVIHVAAATASDLVRVDVVDHGPGIPLAVVAGGFNRFFRGSSGTAAPGFGLGLAIAEEIVKAHGGSIGVDRPLGGGTSIWFTLPGSPPV